MIVVVIANSKILDKKEVEFLEKAKKLGTSLHVAIPTDTISLTLTGNIPPIKEKSSILYAIRYVDEVFSMTENNINKYLIDHKASILALRSDDNIPTITANKPKSLQLVDVKVIDYGKSITRYNINYKSYFILNGTYKIKPVSTNEIFPLKKYKYHDRMLWGPNKFNTMESYYQKSMSRSRQDIIKFAYRKYARRGVTFKIKNKKPAKIDFNTTIGCNKKTARCKFFSKKNYITPICCASHIVEILFYVTDLLDKHNITYFIYWGTLLGSLRHKGLIPWDTDADLYIMEEDKEKVIALKDEFNKDFHMSIVDKNFMRVNYSKVNVTHLDIYIANITFTF
jgi:glycerol-3-phosphate cytidylyltransferase-like family protein